MTPPDDRLESRSSSASGRFIYLAGPWAPMGGGMYKLADYLIQAQAPQTPAGSAELRALDTRGAGSALGSLLVLAKALGMLLRGRASGRLAGVHVNVAERLSLLRKGAVVMTCRAIGVPVVLHLHAAQLHHFFKRLPLPLKWLTRWVFSLPESVVVLGTASKHFVVNALGVPPDRVEILINGVPAPSVARRPEPSLPFKLLFVGNLSDRKGVPDLLQAMAPPSLAELPLQLTLAGGGDVAAYEARARALGLAPDRVHFEGWADQNAVARHMAEADLLVLPSYDEGLPLVILEALANSVAVVCTPVGEIPHMLSDGDNALLVPPGDVAALADALRRLAQNPALRERLERNGRALYAQNFSLTRFFAAVARIHKRHFGVAAAPAQTPQKEDAESPVKTTSHEPAVKPPAASLTGQQGLNQIRQSP